MTLLRPALFAALLISAASSARGGIVLDLPVKCELGKTCWVQQLPDHDAGPEASDYTCGSVTYDGHDGTDIRVGDTTSKVDVIASAAGIVKGARDGMPDKLARTPADLKAVAKRECGNGVVIAHEGGYETQYCHMKHGSISVKPGQKVKMGDRLGLVGFSGAAAFPHVHLSVRKDGKKLDPFSGELTSDCLSTDQSMWSPSAQAALAYEATTVIGFGFAEQPFKLEDLETGKVKVIEPREYAANFVGYVWAINLKKDDVVTLTFSTPEGTPVVNTTKLDRNKAQYFLISGKKKPKSGWPKGRYELELRIDDAEQTRLTRKAWFEIK